ncbi:Phosphopantothenoylcysteine decarboxylase (EC 4.1.1.36) / Phosphopantothenoylcysteine synthetase (EC 6.3.2.5) [uncultured Gammaproteobacteria bacterium]|uniref:bifunctional phosphopantothenoylcysteine decarboxylase/phosphopantothenate--cysteine ligase CoaBC n=1 Tax=Bathymodiolus heckerae thiotrophic gill symbiont TaxID=1052212 RepID=UPI0010B23408|nr:bifunctional phosphopantothenoylcysteine decarboxylase/phosphopantothenate--cysteine ligase CoaBC [Bathymodiolus heckerae thiotrophic gill symbiont]CAC9548417.1 Phosphopantothenoylcysteine decarboxylase (EC 4.1.1.36) / Phosphopantothenoylcysteine synthetase (EC 6.3.2.5) [uncultured Gammaproteobacteria bacterium]CAC9580645.1 Phosphopantothenoylcysteine decarboxylase (EC 4.1.1.36) / Phosphopantothenoylcysteine synthetase (EC 6.3.2.5) [uncultured Gammaproteobacteria bacterium]CAC9603878.1 Phosph
MSSLTNKRIILGVSGSISAYKSPDIVRRLQDLGAEVRVILTAGGAKFITELSLQAISKNKVHNNLWDKDAELSMGHIELAKWADLILIAPASANTIANIANGKACDLLTSVILASTAKLMIAPAMNQQMYQANALQTNLDILISRQVSIIQPESGVQACGDTGLGRLPESSDIANQVAKQFETTQLSGKNVLVTVGATIEPIDPVRYISNHSSGKMGMALVDRCIEMGAKVTCIYANISIPLNDKALNIQTLSADQMHESVMSHINQQQIFIAVAAVSDYRVKNLSNQKIKKSSDNLILELIPNKDILADVCKLNKKPLCIGFAAETQNILENAQIKLKNKASDVIILNDVSSDEIGFNSDKNQVIFISQNQQQNIAKNSKIKIADNILKIFIKEFL